MAGRLTPPGPTLTASYHLENQLLQEPVGTRVKLLSPELDHFRPIVNAYNHEPDRFPPEPFQIGCPNLDDLRATRIPCQPTDQAQTGRSFRSRPNLALCRRTLFRLPGPSEPEFAATTSSRFQAGRDTGTPVLIAARMAALIMVWLETCFDRQTGVKPCCYEISNAILKCWRSALIRDYEGEC